MTRILSKGLVQRSSEEQGLGMDQARTMTSRWQILVRLGLAYSFLDTDLDTDLE